MAYIYKTGNVNFDAIRKLDTPEACYLLGLFWADGYLTKQGSFQIESLEKDLTELLPIFEYFGKWTISIRHRENRQSQMRIQARQQDFRKWLCSINFNQKNNHSPDLLLNLISDNLKPFWFRGYFDGDGSFYVSKDMKMRHAVLALHYDAPMGFFEIKLDELNIRYKSKITTDKKGYRNSRIRFVGMENIKKFGDYIYRDYENLGLQRKYLKYLECIKPKISDFHSVHTLYGEQYTIAQLSRKFNIERHTLEGRINRNWSVKDAVMLPVRSKRDAKGI